MTILFSIPVIGLSLALSFYEVNGRPFITAIEHAFGYFVGSKLYLWKQKTPDQNQKAAAQTATAQPLVVPTLSDSRLRDLAWSLNIKDRTGAGGDTTTI